MYDGELHYLAMLASDAMMQEKVPVSLSLLILHFLCVLSRSNSLSKDLQRNGVDTEEEIYQITYYGKGRMPGFGEMCTPRGQCTFGARLKEDEIKLLANFVKSQADEGWSNIESSGD
ncbi:hypothetical protein L1887_32228 [Cichorium endivia]|nr:hypothetical protein L1887_32228 [Cichorium endivia]